MRVSSEGTQKRIFILGDPLQEGETPDRLSLYLADGTPIDLSPDPTKMRYRGPWAIDVDYISNDVVTVGTQLFILYLVEELAAGGLSPIAPGSIWTVMAASDGMVFKGEWEPGSFPLNSVVTHDGKLWVTEDGVSGPLPFEFVGSVSDSNPAAPTNPYTVSLPVPVEAAVGDLMIFSAIAGSFAFWPEPDDAGWTTIIQTQNKTGSFPPAQTAVYGKLVEEGDLESIKGWTRAAADYYSAQLYVVRGMGIPDPVEVDVALTEGHTFGTPLVVAAGVDPAETTVADKVMRIFSAMSQNYASDTDDPQWETSAPGGEDELLSNSYLNVVGMGSYWAEPAAVNSPDFRVICGEHKYAVRIAFRFPSPSEFDEADWTLLVPEPKKGGFKGTWVDDRVYDEGSIVRHSGSLYGCINDVLSGIMAPDAVVGANWGGPYIGLQATTLDKLDDGVEKIITLGPDTPICNDGQYGVPLAIDFTSGTLVDLNLHVVNESNVAVSFLVINMTSGLQGGLNTIGAGATGDDPVNFATYFGGTGEYVVILRTGAGGPWAGDVKLTLTGASMVAPDVANPWTKLISYGEIEDRLVDLETAPPPASMGWAGEWLDSIAYSAKSVVRHLDALWYSPDGAAIDSTPGDVLEATAASPGGSAPAGTYDRLVEGVTAAVPYDATGSLLFFDLVDGGTAYINSTMAQQYLHLFNSAGTEIATSPGLWNPITKTGLTPGRYWIQAQPGGGGSGTSTMTLTLSAGATGPGASPWELMLQGVP